MDHAAEFAYFFRRATRTAADWNMSIISFEAGAEMLVVKPFAVSSP
jgi:hypothetical protein